MNVMNVGSSLVLDVAPSSSIEPALGPFGDASIERGTARGWDLLGTVPVPLRHWVRDAVADLVTGLRGEIGAPLKCCFPLGQGGHTPFERLRYIRTLDEFPHMLVSCEHGTPSTGAFTGSRWRPVLSPLASRRTPLRSSPTLV